MGYVRNHVASRLYTVAMKSSHSSIHSFIQSVLDVPGTVLGIDNPRVTKTKSLPLRSLRSAEGKRRQAMKNKYSGCQVGISSMMENKAE